LTSLWEDKEKPKREEKSITAAEYEKVGESIVCWKKRGRRIQKEKDSELNSGGTPPDRRGRGGVPYCIRQERKG